MTSLIGISGKLQSGKDTVTKIIQWLLLNQDKNTKIPFDKFDLYKESYTWKNVKFADKLKDMVCLILGCTREQLEDPKFKKSTLGEEWWSYRTSSGTLYPYLTYPGDVSQMELIVMTPRLLLQLLGTECGRQIIHPDIWVNATFANFSDKEEWFRKETGLTRTEYLIKNGHSDEYKTLNEQFFISLSKWIISDVRFPNEAIATKKHGGILIRVNRFCYDSLEDFLVCYPDEKISKEAAKIVKNHEGNYSNLITKLLAIPESNLYFSKHESEVALDNFNDWDYIIDNNGTIEDLIEKVKQILITEGLLIE